MRDDAARWEKELERAGWRRYKGMLTVWQSPAGALYRGPYGAWLFMMRHCPAAVDVIEHCWHEEGLGDNTGWRCCMCKLAVDHEPPEHESASTIIHHDETRQRAIQVGEECLIVDDRPIGSLH